VGDGTVTAPTWNPTRSCEPCTVAMDLGPNPEWMAPTLLAMWDEQHDHEEDE
jgi:hypothetical protein